MALSVLLFVATLLLAHQPGVVVASDEKTPIWQDLVINDCVGGFHILPSSPFGIHVDVSTLLSISKAFVSEVKDRANCKDPSLIEDDIFCQFIPTVEMIMNLTAGVTNGHEGETSDSFDGFPRYSFWDKRMPIARAFASYLGMTSASVVGTSVVLDGLFPSSCDPKAFKTGEACRASYDVSSLGIKVGLTLKKCPDKTKAIPYFALSCVGELCSKFGKPCENQADCGSTGQCYDVPLQESSILSVMQSMGLISPSETSKARGFASKAAESLSQCMVDAKSSSVSTPWRLVNMLENYVRSYFGESSKPASAQLSICIPQAGFPQIDQDLTDSVTCNNVQNRLQSSCFATTTSSLDTLSNTCEATGCQPERVGDLVCDQSCNNKACHWDGGDCSGPPMYTITRNFTGAAAFNRISVDGFTYMTPLNQPVIENAGCRVFERDIVLCKMPFCDPGYLGFSNPSSDFPNNGLHGAKALEFEDTLDMLNNYKFLPSWGNITSADVLSGVSCPSNMQSTYKRPSMTLNERVITWGTNIPDANRFIKPWDGSLADGKLSDDAMYLQGIKYNAPSPSALPSSTFGQTLIRMGCDGSFGLGVGNGLSLRLRIPFVNKYSGLLGNMVKYVQSCRAAANSLAGLSLAVLRTNWEFWDLSPYLYRFTKSYGGKVPWSSSVHLDKLNNAPWSAFMPFLHGTNEFPATQVPVVGGQPQYLQRGWRFGIPNSCTWGNYVDGYACQLEFSGLTSVLGTPTNVLFEATKCAGAELSEGIPSFAIVVTGSLGRMTTPIMFCDDDSGCPSDSVCKDLATLTNIDNVFKEQPLKATSGGVERTTVDSRSFRTLILEDIPSAFVYGQRMAMRQCVEPKGTFKLLRSTVLSMGGGSSDGKADLKVCIVKSILDFGKIADNGQAYINKMFKASGGGSRLDLVDLKAASKSALFMFNGRFKMEKKKVTVTAEEGTTFQSIEISLENVDPETVCSQSQQESIKKGVVAFLKKKRPAEFMFLTSNDVFVDCIVPDTRRRLPSTQKPGSSLKLTIHIQIPDSKVAQVKQALGDEMKDTAGLTKSLGESGVINNKGQTLQPEDVPVIPDVSAPAAKTVPTSSVPPEIINSISHQKEQKERVITKVYYVKEGLSPGAIAGIILASLAFVAMVGGAWLKINRSVDSDKATGKASGPPVVTNFELRTKRNSWANPVASAAPPPPPVALPLHWQELTDAASKKTYYWNKKTNQTSWVHPATMGAV